MNKQNAHKGLTIILIVVILGLGFRYINDLLYANFLRGAFSLSIYVDCFQDTPNLNTIQKMYGYEAFTCEQWAAYLFPEAAAINEERAAAEEK